MLTVGFMHIGKISKVAQIMVASVRKAMPTARVVQMTDADTKPVIGVDDVIRKRYDGKYPMPYRLLHLKDFPDADAVFLDTDVVVQKDLAPIFENEFDIGLTIRDQPVFDPDGIDVTIAMPYNTGVMFSRASGRPFWEAAYRHCLTFSDFEKKWWGDQLSIKAVADTTSLKLKTFPCDLYNYTPNNPEEDVKEKFVVHYKGTRKLWMLALNQRS